MDSSTQNCKNCGAPLAQDANFCESCGTHVAAPVQSARETPKAAPPVKPPTKPSSKKSRIWQIIGLALMVSLSTVALSFFHHTESPLSNPTSLQGKDLSATKTYSISGKILFDANGDGLWDSSDSTLSGATVKLIRPDYTSTTTTTGNDGSYKIENLLPGTYTVTQILAAGWSSTSSATRSVTVSSSDESGINFMAKETEQKSISSTPLAKTYFISGKIFNDINGDGARDSSDPGLYGWTIKLRLPDGTIVTSSTGYNGSYKFVNVPSGTYTVSEDLESGWTATTPAARSVTVSNSDEQGNSFWNHKATEQKSASTIPTQPASGTDPNLAQTWYNKGIALYDQGNYDEAIKAYDEAIMLDPNYAYAWDGKGAALYDQGNYDEAIKALDEAIRLNPNFVEAWYNKGSILDIQGKYDDAINAYDEAIKLNPNYAEAWNGKGITLDKQGKYNEAIQACNKAIELKPDYPLVWNNKGYALKALGLTSEADAAFAKANKLGYTG